MILTARAEEALRKSEETARALLNTSTNSALLLDPEGRLFALNEETSKILGKHVDELVGECVWDFFSPDAASSEKHRLMRSFGRRSLSALRMSVRDNLSGL